MMTDISWQANHNDWNITPARLPNSKGMSIISSISIISFSFFHLMKEEDIAMNLRRKIFEARIFWRRKQMWIPFKRFHFIYRWRRSQIASTSSSQSSKSPSITRNFSQPNSNRYQPPLPQMSVIMAPGFEGTPVTDFKQSNRLACQLSASRVNSKTNLKIHIYDPNPPLLTDIEKKSRHLRISTNFALSTSLLQDPARERTGASVMVKNWPS